MDQLNGDDITRILNSEGPIVTCVLIQANENEGSSEDIITEVTIDTTPQKRQVESVLGGPITFLGQYIDEGVVVMTKKDSNEGKRIQLPCPLENITAYSALLMKVSHDDENEDFFLNYSKDNYLDLVSRGGEARHDSIDEEGSEEDIDSDGVVLGDDEDYDEDFEDEAEMDLDSIGMLNLCMGQILRKFHEENGHGPDTRQLLEMRHALAIKLGVDVPPPEQENEEDASNDEIQTTQKRLAQAEDTPRKRVKWSSYVDEQEIEMVSVETEEQDMTTEDKENDMEEHAEHEQIMTTKSSA